MPVYAKENDKQFILIHATIYEKLQGKDFFRIKNPNLHKRLQSLRIPHRVLVHALCRVLTHQYPLHWSFHFFATDRVWYVFHLLDGIGNMPWTVLASQCVLYLYFQFFSKCEVFVKNHKQANRAAPVRLFQINRKAVLYFW